MLWYSQCVCPVNLEKNGYLFPIAELQVNGYREPWRKTRRIFYTFVVALQDYLISHWVLVLLTDSDLETGMEDHDFFHYSY